MTTPHRKVIPETGYVKILVGRNHPLADQYGYVSEHLLVWCAAGAARPPPGTTLRHRNSIPSDNRLDNLELVTLRQLACARDEGDDA